MWRRLTTCVLLALGLSACSTPRPAESFDPHWPPPQLMPAPPAAWTAPATDLAQLPDGVSARQPEAWAAVLGPGGWAEAFHRERRKLACVDLWYRQRLWVRRDAAGCPAWPGRPDAPEIPAPEPPALPK